MPAAMDALRSEHRTMSHLLTMLERQIELFEETQHPDYDLIKEIIDYFLTYPDLCHHPKEDLILSRLRKRDPEAADRVGALDEEHDDLSDQLRDFSHAVVNILLDLEVPRDTFVKLARDFIDRERKHMANEERVFFPAALEGLTDEDWSEIDSAMDRFKDPLAGGDAGIRFGEIRRYLETPTGNPQ